MPLFSIVSLLLFACTVVLGVNAAAPETFFIKPPAPSTASLYINNDILVINTKYTTRWSTNLTDYAIYLWQQNLTDTGATVYTNAIYTVASGQPGEVSFEWTVSPETFILSASPVFFFSLGLGPNLTDSFSCHYFNITTQDQETSTTAAPTGTTSTAPANGISPSISPSSSASPVPPKQNNGTAIGLGVGLGCLAIVAVFFGYKILQRKNIANKRSQWVATNTGQGSGPTYSDVPADSTSGSRLCEMGSRQLNLKPVTEPIELPGGDNRWSRD